MKAIVQEEYGEPENVLALKEIEKPAIADDEVLVHVKAAAVNAGDWHLATGLPYAVRMMGFGLRRPKTKVRGVDAAGHVEEVGSAVEELQPGDEVFGSCTGAFAEYAGGRQHDFVPKPPNLTFEQAAAVPASALTALQGLRDHGKVQPGQQVLINGASGGVGTFAVQIGKSLGAHVTGVCSTRNVEMVRSIGADHVIDYTEEDFTQRGVRYDLIVDIAPHHSLSDCRRALSHKGTYLLIGDSGGRWLGGLSRFVKTSLLSPFVSQRMRAFVASPKYDDLLVLKELLEAGKVTPVIDRTYPLAQTPTALAYVRAGHARAKVVIAV